jgi:hypothetical protein
VRRRTFKLLKFMILGKYPTVKLALLIMPFVNLLAVIHNFAFIITLAYACQQSLILFNFIQLTMISYLKTLYCQKVY